jgi:Restriction endonuclease
MPRVNGRRINDRRHRTAQLRRIYLRDNGICQLCGQPCQKSDASREHVVRLADGGSSDDDNIILAHKTCNQDADTNPTFHYRNYTSQSPEYEKSWKTMKLRNGAEVPQPTVMTTMLSIDAMENRGIEGAMALWDLYHLAKDTDYPATPTSRKMLMAIGLLREDGSLHRDTADVVLSSFEVDGNDFNRTFPIN